MVAWFIIAIATLAVFAFIAINGVQTVASTTDGVGRVETARRLDAAAAALVARSGSPGNTGRMMVMAGSTVDSVYGLPPELAAYAYTPFGQRIVYCPFGDGESGSSSGAVPSGGGATYPIETRADASGRVFVTAGRPAFAQVSENPNLMGYLIAPRTKTSPTPTCSAVRFNTTTRRFEAPDAFVRPILRATSSDDQRQQASREVVYYVSPSGNGRGLAPNDPTSLYTAVTYYRATLPQAMRIVMATGSYVLPAQYLNATQGGFSDKGNAGTLVIEGQNSQLDFDGLSDIWVPGNLELRNLSVTTAVGVWAEQGHKLTLVNTSTGYLWINNGGILQANNISVTNTRGDWALYVNDGSSAAINGNVTLYGRGTSHHLAAAGASRVVFENANIVLTGNGANQGYGLYNEENADLILKSSTITVANPITFPILVFGRTAFYNSNVQFNVANPRIFELQRGGILTLNGGTFGLGVIPGSGIIDVGSLAVSGTTTIRAQLCWYNRTSVQPLYGGNFLMSSNANSAVTADEGVPGMSANPTAAEVQANADVMARNTRRAQLRGTNTSSYTCQNS
jgi:hypothetical protein